MGADGRCRMTTMSWRRKMTQDFLRYDILRHSPVGRLMHKISEIREEHSIRRTVLLLQTMDDSTLSDIGIGRSDIEYKVRHGRNK
jgi:uncharacterized protein YjiS (DUF1127 family)